MKIKAHKKELENALKKVVPACSSNGTMPVLQGIYMYDNVLLSTNLDIGIKTSYDVDVIEKGKAVLPGKKLLNIVKSLPNEQVNLVIEGNNATIESDGVEFNVSGFDPDEFPSLPEIDESNQFGIAGSVLKKAIDKTVMATSKDDTQPAGRD